MEQTMANLDGQRIERPVAKGEGSEPLVCLRPVGRCPGDRGLVNRLARQTACDSTPNPSCLCNRRQDRLSRIRRLRPLMSMKVNSVVLSDPDAALIARCRAGERDAFGEIVERYKSLVCAIAYSAVGDLQRSEELAQDTFVAAWRGLGDLREPARFRAWLCGITRNTVSNGLRREQREQSRFLTPCEPDTTPHTEPVETSTPCDALIAAEELAVVWRALAGLPETYREPLVLYYRQQESVSSVAAALDLSEEAVRQRLVRGRSLLKESVSALVEGTLRNTGPGAAFTAVVVSSLPALAPPAALTATTTAGGKAAAIGGWGWAILGPFLGLIGTYVGVNASVAGIRSERERTFIRRFAWTFCGYIFVFAAGMGFVFSGVRKSVGRAGGAAAWALPNIMRDIMGVWELVGIFYVAGLTGLVLWSRWALRRIRLSEGNEAASAPSTWRAFVAALAAAGFGAVSWFGVAVLQAGDWLTVSVLVSASLVLLLVTGQIILRHRKLLWRVCFINWLVLLVLTSVLVNARWETWKHTSIGDGIALHCTSFGVNVTILSFYGCALLLLVVLRRVMKRESLQIGKSSGITVA
jgi:RNA polymerase sigma factor (sigma-70 family)